MKVGAEPRKIALLAVLLAILAYVAYTNFVAGGATPQTPRPMVRSAARAPGTPSGPAAGLNAEPARPLLGEFRPSLRPDRRERRPEPAAIDPTLRLDLLERVRSVTLAGGARNLFQFGPAPLPKNPEPKIIPKPPGSEAHNADSKPAEPPKPPPPPIPLKFYGYASPARAGQKRAFFLDGDDIIVAAEGELIKKRYKVVRIGINSAVVEDLEHKHQQTLALEEVL